MVSREIYNPGCIYIEGLKAIAEKKGVGIEEAAKIAEEDLYNVDALEHLEPVRAALAWLLANPDNSPSSS